MAPAPTSSSPALDPQIYSRIQPHAYLSRFLESSYRLDGRAPSSSRPVQLNLGAISTADGSALVRLGETTVVCGVKAELAEPDAAGGAGKGKRGWLVPNLDLPAICGPKYRPGPPGDEAQVCSERLYELLVGEGVVDLEALCIEPGKSAWVLYLDLVCINHDGNAFDASVLACLAALRNTTLPKAHWDEDKKRVICSQEERVPFKVQNHRIPLTFGVFSGQHLLADPSAFEEPLLDTLITISVGDSGRVGVNVAGPAGLEDAKKPGMADGIKVVGECVAMARKRRKELMEVLEGT